MIGFLETLRLQLLMEVSSLGELFLYCFYVLYRVAPTQFRGVMNVGGNLIVWKDEEAIERLPYINILLNFVPCKTQNNRSLCVKKK